MENKYIGTLAIDIGNTNTVVAFQDEIKQEPILIDIPDITIIKGVVPSALWYEENKDESKIGLMALNEMKCQNNKKHFYSNFKRLIGNPYENFESQKLNAEDVGTKFIQILWDNIPLKFKIKRLVLTAPIDTYKGYRDWLIKSFESFKVDEIALVDEPTAAGIGIKVPHGSKLLVIDIGGSTIDLNIVKIEGGEGKSAPIAELLKFNGKDVSKISKQRLRCAEIISKSASKIGGKDIDQWIVDHFLKSNKDLRNFLIAEKIKCLLSDEKLKSEKKYLISLFVNEDEKKDFLISKNILEEILIKNNLIKLLNSLLKNLLNEARGKNCKITDCHSIILVGGGTQIPLIKNWISLKIPEIPINVPPPIESVSIGALSLTPGVKIKDILNKGLSIRLYNKKNKAHFWYPIFVKGQTWPTDNPFELTLQASKNNQRIFEIVIGETNEDNCFDVIFEDGIPKIAEVQAEEMISQWNREPLKIKFQNPSLLGEDCLKLNFCIQKNSHLYLKWNDYLEENEGEFDFGSIY